MDYQRLLVNQKIQKKIIEKDNLIISRNDLQKNNSLVDGGF